MRQTENDPTRPDAGTLRLIADGGRDGRRGDRWVSVQQQRMYLNVPASQTMVASQEPSLKSPGQELR
jgi:hypothetical protein